MDPAKLKVVELRAALAERGLDTKGNKPVLVERLRKALEEESQQHVQEDAPVRMEIIGDTTSEGVLEAARSSQPPKTPSRPSRSSTMAIPTKVSTRNTSRMATTPNSSKQFSPSKAQYLEKAREAMMTISESTSEEFVEQEEISKYSPEKYRGERIDHAVSIIQNETHALPFDESREADATCVLEDDRCEANPFQVPATEPSEKSSIIECIDHSSRIRDKYEMKKSSIDDVNELQQSSVRPAFIDVTRDFTKPKENIEIKEDTDVEVQDTFEKDIEDEIVEKENVEYIEDSYNVKDNVDIPEQPTHVIPDQVDRAYNIDLKEKIIDDKYVVQEENMDISVNTGDVNEKVDAPKDEQVVEMEKIKEDVKMEADESNLDCKDKKRKRSSPAIPVSPVETPRSQESPVSLILEDEPNLDESAVILSWYDSDLNLIIDKEGFLSATPMDNEDLHHMWAGVRASYGFANGKVYYETKIKEYHSITMQEEEQLHKFRVGWSVSSASMQLGEEKFSYAYTNSGKKGMDKEFTDYGPQFNKDDVVGCYLDMTPENTVELSYTLNGKELGSAFSISKEELGDRPLFPHILTKNCTFTCNFGQEDTWCEQIPGYIPAGNVEPKDKVAGARRASKKSDCEVIMVCGLPGAGKTSWARKYAAEHPDKLYNILGCDNLFEKMEDVVLHKGKNQSRQAIMNKCNRAFERLMEIAASRRRNYILDQRSNVYHCHQRRKMRPFCGYQRRAVVIMPTDEEYNQRLSTYDVKKSNLDSSVLEMKAIFSAPSVGEWFDTVEWIGLDEEESAKLIEKYNKEYTEVNQQSPTKQPRLDKIESNKETRDSRNNRDTRDYRDRRNSYQDRGRNSPWRGNMGGWRGERPQRGGYMRHSGGYGPPHPIPWRMRGRGGPVMRGMDRRGGIDRRPVNDRNRPGTARQGGWAPMSGNYQGSQQSGWSQQDNWSGSQSGWSQQGSGWGQQGSWGGGNWKGYQGTYSQAGYNQQQQGYGNSNWNNWNQQYYNNQYWSQQQQSGQTTAAGGQAEIANETTDTGAEYNYSQGWQNFSQGRTTTSQSAATSATQQSHLHK